MIRYRPNVRCGEGGTSPPPRDDCRLILNGMPTDGNERLYGPLDQTGVDVAIPISFTSPPSQRKRCQVVVATLTRGGTGDTSDWYKVWAAAMAVEVMCVKRGKPGVAVGLGKLCLA